MKIRLVDLPDDASKIRTILCGLVEQHVVLNDEHERWMHAYVVNAGRNTYHVVAQDERGQMDLHYDDLNHLFVLKGNHEYPLPELKR